MANHGNEDLSQAEVCTFCGDRGFSNALVNCYDCGETVAHQYCIGIPPGSINGSFLWLCELCCAQMESEPRSSKKSRGVSVKGKKWRKRERVPSNPPSETPLTLGSKCKRIRKERTEDQSSGVTTKVALSNCSCDKDDDKDKDSDSVVDHKMNCSLYCEGNAGQTPDDEVETVRSRTGDQPEPLLTRLPVTYHQGSEEEERAKDGLHLLDSSVSSLMENPEELTGGVVLLVSPSGEVFIHEDSGFPDDQGSLVGPMTNCSLYDEGDDAGETPDDEGDANQPTHQEGEEGQQQVEPSEDAPKNDNGQYIIKPLGGTVSPYNSHAHRAIMQIVKQHYVAFWPYWVRIPLEIREAFFDEFKKKYWWEPQHDAAIQEWFRRHGRKQFTDAVAHAKKRWRDGLGRPRWIPSEEIWQDFIRMWTDKNYVKKCNNMREARKMRRDKAPPSHRMGPVPFSIIRERLAKKLGMEPSTLQQYTYTHTKEGQWIDERFKKLGEKMENDYKKYVEEERAKVPNGQPPPRIMSEEDYWLNKNWTTRGRVLGLGDEGHALKQKFPEIASQRQQRHRDVAPMDMRAHLDEMNRELTKLADQQRLEMERKIQEQLQEQRVKHEQEMKALEERLLKQMEEQSAVLMQRYTASPSSQTPQQSGLVGSTPDMHATQ